MKRCKITILKTMLNEELAKEYAAPGFDRCPMMREGAGFLCRLRQARRVLRRGVEGRLPICLRPLARGREVLLRGLDRQGGRGHLLVQRRLRPVIMKIERTDEESTISYDPVR